MSNEEKLLILIQELIKYKPKEIAEQFNITDEFSLYLEYREDYIQYHLSHKENSSLVMIRSENNIKIYTYDDDPDVYLENISNLDITYFTLIHGRVLKNITRKMPIAFLEDYDLLIHNIKNLG